MEWPLSKQQQSSHHVMSETKVHDVPSSAPSPALSSSSNKVAGSKPKLSILSTKQAGIRLNSDDQPEQQPVIPTVSVSEYQTIINSGNMNDDNAQTTNLTSNKHNLASQKNFNDESSIDEARRLDRGEDSAQALDHMSFSKEDLVSLIHLLKRDLQSKEIALAAIKCEQLKRLLNPVEISRSSLATTYLKLQDRLKAHDQNNNNKLNDGLYNENRSSASTKPLKDGGSDEINPQTNRARIDQDNDESEKESLDILNTLLELLDGHPLLALPRDSIYCLDYNCNELSTKNYLNLKIQHLDNLINQHRRFRFCMNERLRQSEKRCVDIARELELERKLKYENERLQFKRSGKAVLLKQIEQLKELMDKERRDKEAIVMTLLNELLDGKEQIGSLTKRLGQLEESNKNSHKMMEEKHNEIKQETLKELEELREQSISWAKEKLELQTRVKRLESENSNLKETLKGWYKNISSANPTTKDGQKSTTIQSPVSPTKSGNNSSKTPSLVSRVGVNKPTPPVKNIVGTIPAANNSAMSHRAASGQNGTPVTSTTSNQSSSSPSRQASNSGVIINNHKPAASSVGRVQSSSSAGGTSEHSVYRVPPLFKSASLSSTQQQVKKSSNITSVGQNTQSTAPGHSSSSTVTSTSSIGVTRSFCVTNSNKPQVPVKPAQLLDQQRQSLN